MEVEICFIPDIFPNIFLCEICTDLELCGEWMMTEFNFWVKCHLMTLNIKKYKTEYSLLYYVHNNMTYYYRYR